MLIGPHCCGWQLYRNALLTATRRDVKHASVTRSHCCHTAGLHIRRIKHPKDVSHARQVSADCSATFGAAKQSNLAYTTDWTAGV